MLYVAIIIYGIPYYCFIPTPTTAHIVQVDIRTDEMNGPRPRLLPLLTAGWLAVAQRKDNEWGWQQKRQLPHTPFLPGTAATATATAANNNNILFM